ncbi:MAG: DUF3068 domain-containing protein [Thermoplasmata archaeon]|nr:MAG: DUF3068 domain-containing protein [Thermoplasmata archaeon]
MRGKRNAMAIVGLVFFIIAPSFSFVLTPSMKKIPDNLHQIIYYDGKLGMFNTTTLQMDYEEVEIKRELTAIGKEGDVLMIREDISAIEKRTGKEIPDLHMTKIYGIDPYTSKNIPGYGDTSRIAQWIFPVGVKKKDYLVWNTDLDEAYSNGYVDVDDVVTVGYYRGEEMRGGIRTYKYIGGQDEIYIGPGPEGTPPEANLSYEAELTAWVDPETGTIVDLDKHIIQYLSFPDLHVLPSNLNVTAILIGNISIFNISKAGSGDWYDRYNAIVSNHLWVEEVKEDFYLVGSETIITDEKGKRLPEELQGKKSIDAVNPRTMEYVPFFSEREGLMTFPIGVEKKNYLLWDSDIKNTSLAQFIGEESIGGLQTYKYVTKVSNYPVGKQEIEGMSDRWASLYYTGNTTYWVEPSTGYIVNVEKKGEVKAQFPDLHVLPENTEGTLEMEGEMWIISQGKKEIAMTRHVKAIDVEYEGKNKVIIFEDNTTLYDKKTGKVIPEGSSVSIHGVYAETAEEAPNYGDMEREGLFTFPPGVEKKSYSMWNPEIYTSSPVQFVREEDHAGVHTYLFKTEETRKVFDPTPMINQNVIYTTLTKYWVEPNTGLVIDMEKVSEKKVDILNFLIGIPSPFWVRVYSIKLSFTDDMVEALVEEAKKSRELIKLSENTIPVTKVELTFPNLLENVELAKLQKKQIERLSSKKVKVVDLHYWMSEKSVKEMVDMAEKAGFLLLLLGAIVPILLVFLGIVLLALWVVNKPRVI